MTSIEQLFGKEEEVCDELKPFVTQTSSGFPMIHHPLLVTMFTPRMAAIENEQFRRKKELVERKIKAKEWGTVIALHERPYRVQAFSQCMDKMSPVAYWEHAAWCWIDSENIWQNKALWRKIWQAKISHKIYAMETDEQATFHRLPETVRVWRGVHSDEHDKDGFSWTLDHGKAVWFAQRWKTNERWIITGEVKRSAIHAVLLGRGEAEVVSTRVKRIAVERV